MAEQAAAAVPAAADFSRESLIRARQHAADLLDSEVLLTDEEFCMVGIVARLDELLGTGDTIEAAGGSAPDVSPVIDIAKHRRAIASAKKPIGDITDQEIQEWKFSRSGVPGVRFAGYTAESIRKGLYDGGKEICGGDRSMLYREITEKTLDDAMKMLIERNMVRRVGKSYYVADVEELRRSVPVRRDRGTVNR